MQVRPSRRSFGSMQDASTQTQDASTQTQDARRVAAGAVNAEHPQRRCRMPTEWTRNARSVDAKRLQCGRKTPADAVPSYFLAVLYAISL